MYAGDINIFAKANYSNYQKLIQNNLNNLIRLADSWQLKINFDKCHAIHFGHINSNFKYNLDMHKIDASVKKF